MTSEHICPVCQRPVTWTEGVYRVCGTDYHAACFEWPRREPGELERAHDSDATPPPAPEWAELIGRPDHSGLAPGSGAPTEGHGTEADRVASDLAVTLEVWLDVKDIALQDAAELFHLKDAFARVDRGSSVGSWPAAEPVAMTEWRRGLVRRAPRSDVAAAILHALQPYHTLMRRARPTLPGVVVRVPAERVATVKRTALMAAWFEQMRQIVSRDPAERSLWTRYWVTMGARPGTREGSLEWRREVAERARCGSEVAARMIEAIRHRDDALAALARLAAHRAVIPLDVPGID